MTGLQNDHRPIYVLAAPRTGSTLLTESVYLLFAERYGYLANLEEIFSERVVSDSEVPGQLQRIQQHRYCFKLLSYHVPRINSLVGSDFLEVLNGVYQPVYIQRKTVTEQILSWQYMLQNQTGTIDYNPAQAERMLEHIEQYHSIASQHASRFPRVYYEDLVGVQDRIRYLCEIFNIDQQDLSPELKLRLNTDQVNRVQNKSGSYRDLVENTQVFDEHVQQIEHRIKKLEG